MNGLRSIKLPPSAVHAEKLGWFRFGRLGERVVLTTDTGAWHALEPDAFSSFVAGELAEDGEEYAALLRKGFVRDGFDVELHAIDVRRTKRFLDLGTTHHRIHLSTAESILSIAQAKSIVDHIFTNHGETLTISLIQGPKPPDIGLISFIRDFADEKNQYEHRQLVYELHSSLEGLDDALIDHLVDKQIQVCALYDGSQDIHDAQRHLRGAATHKVARERIQAIGRAADKAGLSSDAYSTFAEVQVGSSAVGAVDSILSGLAEAGIRDFRVRPILEGEQALSPRDCQVFFGELLRALDAQSGKVESMREVQLDALMARIRSGDLAEHLLMSTPRSTGYNARSYGPDGNIFPSCSALTLHEQGDPIFLLGNVASVSAEDVGNHPTIRSLMIASLTDCLPGYQHLWSAPYISVDPISEYRTTGDIFPKMPTSTTHRASQAMVEAVFLHLMDAADAE